MVRDAPHEALQRTEPGLERLGEALLGLRQRVRAGERRRQHGRRFEADGHGVRAVVVGDGKEGRAGGDAGRGREPEVADASRRRVRDRHHRFARGGDATRRGAALGRGDAHRETDVLRRPDQLSGPCGELGIVAVRPERGTDAQEHALGHHGAVERLQRRERIRTRPSGGAFEQGLSRDAQGLDLVPRVGDGLLRALEKGERGVQRLRVGGAAQRDAGGNGANAEARAGGVARRPPAPFGADERAHRRRSQHREHVSPRPVIHFANECSGPGYRPSRTSAAYSRTASRTSSASAA